MNLWAKLLAYGTAFACATGTTAKVTYDYALPRVGKKLTIKKDTGNGQKVDVWVPDELDYLIPEDSKLQMILGESNNAERTGTMCISVSYNGATGNQGGVILRGSLSNKTDLRGIPICNSGQQTWTIKDKKGESKKIRCDNGYVLGVDAHTNQEGKKLLKCIQKADTQASETYKLGNPQSEPKEVTCTRQIYTNQFTCTSEGNFSLRYTAIARHTGGGNADPAIEVASL
ncbi:hypothetical protein MHLP_04115 [Candidatus Mycoplasma haematolamae str. Purdue]|uniref:Uncharacterized protein n=1 Tax=Mycoplasma haematolamae (strain Purdue) TaxID=1212765 RepID=I7BKI6_MYCHA|nr:hypothetical protein [Candidatus Mycoplasma haematolamae]AFO52403.1 hypothetical protein MHLP_04115 [Candidatus Mycoplasma haematolamae str. Purdue]